MNDASARQMSREVPAGILARKASNLDCLSFGLGLSRTILCRCGDQFLQLQLQLIEQPLAALGARTEQLALHLGDHQLKVLDQRLGAGQFGARIDQRCLQRILVVGKMMISCRCHEASESQIRLIRRRNSTT